MKEPVIKVRDLWFSYNNVPVLRDINFYVEKGDFLAILGPNGGGKSTLLKLLLGILRPDQGEIQILGQSPSKVRARMGYMPQYTHIEGAYPISVIEVVLMGRLTNFKFGFRYGKKDLAKARDALEKVDMWKYRDSRISELSGGQRQKVLIARALVPEPEILFLDEPTASVDNMGRSALFDLLHELNDFMTIIVVSHDISVLSRYAKSVACVNETLYLHHVPEITPEMFEMTYGYPVKEICPVELMAHGLPHRVLEHHEDESGD